MVELTALRTEYSKTFDLDNGKRRLQVGGMLSHYKDVYSDVNEQWKECDLAIVDGKITKAPYELAVKGNIIDVKDKKTGNTSTIEIAEIGDSILTEKSFTVVDGKLVAKDIDKDIDFELILSDRHIKFQRIIKSSTAAKTAVFKISGTIPVFYHAEDADGDPIVVEKTIDKDNKLIENFATEKTIISIDKNSKLVQTVVPVKYPIKIDPILTIQGEGKDCYLMEWAKTTNNGTDGYFQVLTFTSWSRYPLIELPLTLLPSGSTITSATFSLYYYANGGATAPTGENCVLYKIRRTNWVETEATWNIYKSGSNWGTGGAANTSTDIDTTKTASQSVPANFGWMAWNVKTICEDAQTNGINFNVRMNKPAGKGSEAYFESKNSATVERRPKLVIDFVGPSIPIKVGGAWKASTSQLIKVGGAWKAVIGRKIKIGGAWK